MFWIIFYYIKCYFYQLFFSKSYYIDKRNDDIENNLTEILNNDLSLNNEILLNIDS